MHQHRTLEDTVYFWFAANTTAGTAGDGATPTFAVRKAGASSSAAPTLTGTPTLLSHASFSDGSHEIAVAATAANGFEAGATYGVFCSLTISTVNPNGFVGSFELKPVLADVRQLLGTAWLTPATAGTPDVNTKLAGGTAWGSGAITAASIAADAITDAKVASDVTIASVTGAVGSVTGAVGSVTGNVGGNVTGSVGSVAAGGIAAASFAAGAITSTVLATDAIDADALAADAVTEIQSGLATAANLATVAGYLDTEIAAILADTNELQTDWVNGGRLDLLIDAIKTVTDQLAAAQAEPSAVPAANATPLEKLAWLAALARNKITQTSTTQALRNDADSSNIATSTVSDDGTTAIRGEWT